MDVFGTLKAFKQDLRSDNDSFDSMPVKRGCICPNHGEPNADGVSYFSPACQVDHHGLRSPCIVYCNAFGGYMAVLEGGGRKHPKRQRCRLPPALPESERLEMLHQAAARIAHQLQSRTRVPA
jgi:hypothetical protein